MRIRIGRLYLSPGEYFGAVALNGVFGLIILALMVIIPFFSMLGIYEGIRGANLPLFIISLIVLLPFIMKIRNYLKDCFGYY